MLSLRGLPPPDLHVGDGKYYCHYAEEVAEAGAVICRNLNWSDWAESRRQAKWPRALNTTPHWAKQNILHDVY